MSRWTLVLVALCSAATLGWLGTDWLQLSLWRVLKLTTADPGMVGMVASDSMEPVEVVVGSEFQTIVSKRDAAGRPQEVQSLWQKRSITFRVPAAFISMTGKARGETYPWMVGFKVWNNSFAPFMPDLLLTREDRKRRGIDPNAPLTPEDHLSKKLQSDNAFEFKVTSPYTRDADRRAQTIEKMALRTEDKRHCDRVYVPNLDMVRVSGPDGSNSIDTCLGGSGLFAMNYLKRSRDGSAKFAVICGGQSSLPTSSKICTLHSYFDGLNLQIHVPYLLPQTYDATYDRVIKFLSDHTKREP